MTRWTKAVLVALPAVALAQAPVASTPVEPPAPAPAPAEPPAPPPESYTVVPGDTLWDLSSRFLASPWSWPRLWSYNPQIANPNWIYPGNVIRFGPAGEGAPAEPPPVAEAAEAPKDAGDVIRGDLDRAGAEDDDVVAMAGAYRIVRNRPGGPPEQRNSFVTAERIAAAAKIVAAFDEKMMLTTGDRFYARFPEGKGPEVGRHYSIFRIEEKVHHPVTGSFVGWKTVILGTARVTAVDPAAATSLVITGVNDGVERGDLLGPASELARKPLVLRPNRVGVEGVVIGVQPSIVTGASEYSVVYLDRGSADGVEVGNTFEVVRSGDPYNEPIDRPLNDPRLPTEVIGNLVVFDAQEHAASAFVRRSIFEILVGDHVRMRPAAQAPKPAAAPQGG